VYQNSSDFLALEGLSWIAFREVHGIAWMKLGWLSGMAHGSEME
jgi:hypothetical protein